MPLYNRLKEYRARLGVNQQEMGRGIPADHQPD
jgi:putative transcriptional regulator